MRRVAALVVPVLLLACPTSPSEVKFNAPFTLAPGQSADVEGLRVTFDRVASDSRCPIDVTCVWEGDAVVVVSLRASGREPASVELHTSGRFAQDASYGDYRIRLAGLEPVARSDRPIAPSDYRATFVVSP